MADRGTREHFAALEIFSIGEGDWRVEDGGVYWYLLSGSEKALVVDTGMSGRDVLGTAKELTHGRLPIELLCTHADGDHVGSNDQFEWCWMHPSEGIVYHNIGGHAGHTRPVREGEIIDLGGRALEVVHLPGHTPGSITLLDRERREIFGGDPIQDGGIYMFGMHRDMEGYISSLEYLMEKYGGAFDTVWPSHGTAPIGAEIVPQLLMGARLIASGAAVGEPDTVHGTPIMAYDVGCARFFCTAE